MPQNTIPSDDGSFESAGSSLQIPKPNLYKSTKEWEEDAENFFWSRLNFYSKESCGFLEQDIYVGFSGDYSCLAWGR